MNRSINNTTSIRRQLIQTLLIALPLLFLIVFIAVSFPLYQQIIDDDHDAMKRFGQFLLNERASQLNFDKHPKLTSKKSERTDSLDNDFLTEDFDSISKDLYFIDEFDYVLWDKSGKLVEDSSIDIIDNNTNNTQENLSPIFKLDPNKLSNGFHNTEGILSQESWQLYVTTHPKTGEKVLIAQPWGDRWRDIFGFVMEQMTLLLLSFPLLLGVVIWSVSKGLTPLNRLAREVQIRHANDLSPVSESVPQELKPLTHSLNQLFNKVADGMDKQKRFTSDASHELKSPITAIKLQANDLQYTLTQILLDNPTDKDMLESIQTIDRIQKIADRSSHLIEQLLTLTKLDDEKSHTAINKSPINWLTISEQALQSVSRTARNYGIKLQFHVHTDEGKVLPLLDGGNQALLVLMIRNLLENAIVYGSNNTNKAEHRKIELTLDKRHIIIRDYGKGIEIEHLARIRERFFRPAGQTHSGSGLGLSIVDRISEIHGLTVDINNHPDGGVLVTIH